MGKVLPLLPTARLCVGRQDAVAHPATPAPHGLTADHPGFPAMGNFLRELAGTLRLTRRRTPNVATFWELDALRGIAIVMMVTYHLLFDLDRLIPFTAAIEHPFLDIYHPFWDLFQKATAYTFVTLAGVSSAVAYHSAAGRTRPPVQRRARQYKRGLIVFCWGMVLTLITWLVFRGGAYIQFGILHMIGLGLMACAPLLGNRWLVLTTGALSGTAGLWLSRQTWDGWLADFGFWLGFQPAGYAALDYVPFLFYFGLFLLGSFLGILRYQGRTPPQVRSRVAQAMPVQWLETLGQHSLAIYLLHQPVLLAGLLLLSLIVVLL
ncbi:MAG: DUF1624 domain-containing protein [Caldilineaceae bacterium SB0666_bin_21]|nr:DUF1624 domain-containing protein [Caldilineaceae bacterium SB0666_bin_21]